MEPDALAESEGEAQVIRQFHHAFGKFGDGLVGVVRVISVSNTFIARCCMSTRHLDVIWSRLFTFALCAKVKHAAGMRAFECRGGCPPLS